METPTSFFRVQGAVELRSVQKELITWKWTKTTLNMTKIWDDVRLLYAQDVQGLKWSLNRAQEVQATRFAPFSQCMQWYSLACITTPLLRFCKNFPNWTSGVSLGRLLWYKLIFHGRRYTQLELITNPRFIKNYVRDKGRVMKSHVIESAFRFSCK